MYNFNEELWKPVVGYEELYHVSNKGRVKRLNNKFSKNERILKLQNDKDGYLVTNLSKLGKIKSIKVHRLVAETFICNKENKPTVNHKNGIKTDNRVDNLEWATRSENNLHALRNGFKRNTTDKQISAVLLTNKLKRKPISMYDFNGLLIMEFDCAVSAANYIGAKHATNINKCALGYAKSAYGFIWKYSLPNSKN